MGRDRRAPCFLFFLALCYASCAGANLFADRLSRLHGPLTGKHNSAWAGDIALPESRLVARSLEGLSLPVDLAWHGRALGQARFVGGVARDKHGVRVASSGVLWSLATPDSAGLRLGALQTGMEGSREGGEVLVNAATWLPLAALWSAPELRLEYASFHGESGAGVRGDALRLSVRGETVDGDYGLRFTHSDAGFQPYGRRVAAGRSAGRLFVNYAWKPWLTLHNELRVDRVFPHGHITRSSWRNTSSLSLEAILPEIEMLQLSTSLGQRARRGHAPLPVQAVAAQATGMQLAGWQLRSGLSWEYGASLEFEDAAARWLWSIAGKRWLRVGALAGWLRSGVQLTDVDSGWGGRTRLGGSLAGVDQRLSMGVDYSAGVWSQYSQPESTVRVTMEYRLHPASLLAAVLQ
ncbi:MAG: hypothetical protein L0H83_00425 [Salinisphaera sp.]|nr:hypothetical protein [Salinisphaera sp.]